MPRYVRGPRVACLPLINSPSLSLSSLSSLRGSIKEIKGQHKITTISICQMVDDSVCDDGLKQDYGDEESKNKNEKKLLLRSSESFLNISKNLYPSPHHNKRWEKVLYPSGPIIIPRQSCRHPTWGGASVPAQHPLTRQNKTINNTVGPNICWSFKARQSLRLATITLLCLLSPLPTTTFYLVIITTATSTSPPWSPTPCS